MLTIVQDNPEPLPDLITTTTFFAGLGVDPNTVCLIPNAAFFPLLSGNVVVHDA
jgi:hypothetical protein